MAKYIVVHGIKIAKDFTPETFGRLTTLGPRFRLPVGKSKQQYQVCLCSCGSAGVYHTTKIKIGHTSSCGCLQKELTGDRARTHGQSLSPEYNTWQGMLKRCSNKNGKDYKDYGGRGIRVFPDWDCPGGFELWFAYMGPRPSKNHSLDRIDVDGNYEPGNVRWATVEEQANNTTKSIRITHEGLTMTLTQWAAHVGLHKGCLRTRLQVLGWDFATAITTPSGKKRGTHAAT